MRFLKNQQARDRAFSMLFVIVSGILLIALIFKFDQFKGLLLSVYQKLFSIWFAFGLAFIVIEPMKKLEKAFMRLPGKRKKRARLARALSITVCYLLLIVIIILFLVLIVPQLIDSIKTLSASATRFYQTYARDVITFLEEYNIAGQDAQNVVITWEQIMSTALDVSGKALKGIASASLSITSNVIQALLGLALSVYMLFDRERLAAQLKKVLYAFSSVRVTNELIIWTRKSESIFSSYIAGKLIESLIVGAIAYVVMLCFRMDYAVLISVVVALTNVVPIVGPWIGAIIGTLILLLINPIRALWFLIMIVVIQQLDGNLLGPRILGSSTGISSFWTLIALILGGGFWGIAGMFLSIPIFATAYAIIKTVCNLRLKDKSLPTDLTIYKEQGVVFTEELEQE